MALNLSLRLLHPLRRVQRLALRCESTTESKDEIVLSEVATVPELPDPQDAERLMQMRNKSRLTDYHRNVINGMRPYEESKAWYHDTVRYKKRMLGRFGLSCMDVTPGVAWPTPEQVEDKKEYERVAYPRTIQEEWEIIKKANEERAEKIRLREAEVAEKAAKSEKWINDLQRKIQQKEEQLRQAKQLRARVIEEVKRELNIHSISLGDEKVMDLIAKKEKQYRKKLKEEKKMKKEEKRTKNRATADDSESPA